MAALHLRWRCTRESGIPEAVECTERGYPHKDAHGAVQYENTHFDTEAEAWTKGRAEVRAGLSISASAVREAERRLQEAKERLVRDALRVDEFEAAAKEAGWP